MGNFKNTYATWTPNQDNYLIIFSMVHIISHFSFGLKWTFMVESRKKQMETTDAQNKLMQHVENWDFLLYFFTLWAGLENVT